VEKALGGAAPQLDLEMVAQGPLATSVLLRLPSAALAAQLKERLGSKLLSIEQNVTLLPSRLKHG